MARPPGRQPPRHSIGGPIRPRWPRRVLVAVNLLVAVCLVAVGTVYGYVRYRLDSIRTVPAPHLTPTGRGRSAVADSAGGLPEENILLIGNETRAGLTDPSEIARFGSPTQLSGSLSDVIMILHLDPAKDTASILSIPRDLFVPMPPGTPAGSYQKIDAALNDGAAGADNLIQTITNDLGIPINHYVELNFDGFQNTVNALGGINVQFPEPLFDLQSGLYIPTAGCIHLNGSQALALVRSRHLQYDPPGNHANRAYWPFDPESDLSRIVRDHTFLRVVAATAESNGLTNPLKANAFLGAIINQITIDPGLKGQLISLATHYRHLNPAAIPETTLPVTQVGGASGYQYNRSNIGDVDFPVQPSDNQVIAAWDANALPAPAAPSVVNVVNISPVVHAGANMATALRAEGLNVMNTTTGVVPALTSETLVKYGPGNLAQAVAVVDHLSGAVMLQQQQSIPLGTIEVDVGSTVAVPGAAPVAASTASGGTATSVAPSPTTSGPGTSPATTTPAVPTPHGQAPSASADVNQPWDPQPCGV
jgi:LCP family protein required for cell wall assembly